MMAITKFNLKSFAEYVEDRYEGRVLKLEYTYSPYRGGIAVHVQFHIPDGEGDELEVFRRINKVIEVIAEGDDEG